MKSHPIFEAVQNALRTQDVILRVDGSLVELHVNDPRYTELRWEAQGEEYSETINHDDDYVMEDDGTIVVNGEIKIKVYAPTKLQV